MTPPSPPIIVIGAGVIGLTTAVLLQSSHPQSAITMIAAELPTTRNHPSTSADYASMWAGAHYRPIPVSSTQLADEKSLAVRTFEIMKRIAKESPESGVQVVQGVEFLEAPPEENLRLKTGDVYAGEGDGFRVLERSELPASVKWGCEYTTYVVNVHRYCQWLLDGFGKKGGRVVHKKLRDAREAFDVAANEGLGRVGVVVNCSGRNFDADAKMNVIRGQTVLVKQQYDKTITRQTGDGSWSFLIPRPLGGGTVVGGTKEVGDLEVDVRAETRTRLLEAAAAAFPDFVDRAEAFEVLGDNVGRRPWREGGLRIETEHVDARQRIVHGYGAGGRGYELSWGAGERIVELVAASMASVARL